MVPAEFHAEQRRTRKLRQSLSPNLARPLDPSFVYFMSWSLSDDYKRQANFARVSLHP
jgi:hypothetical protein